MADPYTLRNLGEVDDAAPENGLGEYWEARVARRALDAEQTGIAFFRLRPGRRSAFAHRHAEAEEIYVILRGHGRMKLDDEIVAVGPLDAIRVSPPRGAGVRGRRGRPGLPRLRGTPPPGRRAGRGRLGGRRLAAAVGAALAPP